MTLVGRAVLLAATIALSSCSFVKVFAQTNKIGRIDGTVLYEDGRPVDGATVYAYPADRGMAGNVPSATTDEQGRFQIAHLWLGQFAIGAKKENEGYPDTGKPFYSDGRKLEYVTLTAKRPSATVTVLLGPKAGVLVGRVEDAVTKVPIDPCVDFHLVSDPNNFLSGTGLVNAKYRVLVPPNQDLIMKIWHEGYLPWYYPGTSNKSKAKPLRLKSGEQRTLNIRLQRGTDASDAGCNSSLCFPHCRP